MVFPVVEFTQRRVSSPEITQKCCSAVLKLHSFLRTIISGEKPSRLSGCVALRRRISVRAFLSYKEQTFEHRAFLTKTPVSGIHRVIGQLRCCSLQEKSLGLTENAEELTLNRPGFPGEYFICELRLPDHYFRWKHNKLFLLLPEEYGPAFPAIVDCYTSPPTLVWPVPLLSGFSSSYGVLPPLCKDH